MNQRLTDIILLKPIFKKISPIFGQLPNADIRLHDTDIPNLLTDMTLLPSRPRTFKSSRLKRGLEKGVRHQTKLEW